MKSVVNKVMLVLVVAFLAGNAYGLGVWDLATDWSPTPGGNPDGPWSFHFDPVSDPSETLFVYDVDVASFSNLPGYVGTEASGYPGIAATPFLGVSDLGMWSVQPVMVRWTAPQNMPVEVNIVDTMHYSSGQHYNYDISLNGASFASGVIPDGPTRYDLGTYTMNVLAGDEIEYALWDGSTWNYFDMTVTEIPEPMTMALLGLGSLVALRRRRS